MPGKTSLISQLLYDSVPEEHIPTVEEMYRWVYRCTGEPCHHVTIVTIHEQGRVRHDGPRRGAQHPGHGRELRGRLPSHGGALTEAGWRSAIGYIAFIRTHLSNVYHLLKYSLWVKQAPGRHWRGWGWWWWPQPRRGLGPQWWWWETRRTSALGRSPGSR